jgi:hypothetical protein
MIPEGEDHRSNVGLIDVQHCSCLTTDPNGAAFRSAFDSVGRAAGPVIPGNADQSGKDPVFARFLPFALAARRRAHHLSDHAVNLARRLPQGAYFPPGST